MAEEQTYTETPQKKASRFHEFDVIAVAGKVLKHYLWLLLFLVLFGTLGVVVALNTQKTFTAEVVLAPEMDSGGISLSESLSDMASSFGIDLGGSKTSMDAIYPQIYPNLLASNDFILPLLDVQVQQKDSTTQKTYLTHLMKDGKVPFWDYPKLWLLKEIKKRKKQQPAHAVGQGLDPFRLTQDEEELVEGVKGSISCLVDKKTSVISISVTDIDPQVAAIIADTLQKRLQAYITKYRTKKARKDVTYYKQLLEESKKAYNKAQRIYANYADSNQEASLEIIRSKESELENEMQLKYNVYSQMQAQLQQAKARVQEKTPAFTIIQNATVPNKPSGTPRSMIVFFFLCLGVAADALWVLWLKDKIFHRKKKETKEEDVAEDKAEEDELDYAPKADEADLPADDAEADEPTSDADVKATYTAEKE